MTSGANSTVIVASGGGSGADGGYQGYGTTLPASGALGDTFTLTQIDGANQIGTYYNDGTNWVQIPNTTGINLGSGSILPPTTGVPNNSTFYLQANNGTGGLYILQGGLWVLQIPEDQDWKKTVAVGGSTYPHQTSDYTGNVIHNGPVQIGVNTDSPNVSLSVGTGNNPSGVNSTAFGTNNTANGVNSVSMGTLQNVQANNVFAFGRTARTYSQANVVGISGCRVAIDESNPTAPLHYRTIPIASTDAAAGMLGHTVGAIYMTSTGVVRCKL